MADSLQSILNELSALTADEIATKFEGLGIKGYKAKPSACPMAIFLQNQLQQGIHVSTTLVYLNPSLVYETGIPLPLSVADFVSRFDFEKYPALIAEDQEEDE